MDEPKPDEIRGSCENVWGTDLKLEAVEVLASQKVGMKSNTNVLQRLMFTVLNKDPKSAK